MNEAKDGFHFTVSVNDVTLDDENVSRIEERLRKLMLEELGKIDTGGDLVANPLPTARSIDDGGFDGGRTAGMMISRG